MTADSPKGTRASVPSSLGILLAGALAWGLLMAASALLSLALQDRWQTYHLGELLLVYFCGGFAAWLPAVPLARRLTRRRTIETRFAAHFVLLCLGTVLATAFLFAMDYRQFYAQWHQPFGTWIWLLQLLFTTASALYQFLVMGLRLYLPVGLPVLGGVSLWLAASMR